MNPTTRRLLIGTAIVLLGLYAASSISSAWTAANRLDRQRDDLEQLRRMLAEIEQVSDAPRVAALELEAPDQILNRITGALKTAGLSPNLLANQTPLQPQRIGRTDFTLRRVEIELDAATAEQIVAFCDALRDASTGSLVRDLQLFNPRRTGRSETWNSQMTLTQVIFSPKSDS